MIKSHEILKIIIQKEYTLQLSTWLASTWQVSAPASLESQEYVTLEVAKERDRQFFSQCVSSPEKTQVYISSSSYSAQKFKNLRFHVLQFSLKMLFENAVFVHLYANQFLFFELLQGLNCSFLTSVQYYDL
jgi:hypothetical protein